MCEISVPIRNTKPVIIIEWILRIIIIFRIKRVKWVTSAASAAAAIFAERI